MQYAFNAPDEEMLVWKEAAAEAGLSFAEFLRVLCRNHVAAPGMTVEVTHTTVPVEVVVPKGKREPARVLPLHGAKVFRGPDPRPGGKKKK